MGLYRMEFDIPIDKVPDAVKPMFYQRELRESLRDKLSEMPYDVRKLPIMPADDEYGLPPKERITCDFAVLNQNDLTFLAEVIRIAHTKADVAQQYALDTMAKVIFGDDYKAILKL